MRSQVLPACPVQQLAVQQHVPQECGEMRELEVWETGGCGRLGTASASSTARCTASRVLSNPQPSPPGCCQAPVNCMTQNILKRVLDQCTNRPRIINRGLAAAWQRRLESYMLNSSPVLPALQLLLPGCCPGARRRPAQQPPQTDSPARAAVDYLGAVPPAGGTAKRTVRISGAVCRPASGALSWRGTWPAGRGGRPGSRQV